MTLLISKKKNKKGRGGGNDIPNYHFFSNISINFFSFKKRFLNFNRKKKCLLSMIPLPKKLNSPPQKKNSSWGHKKKKQKEFAKQKLSFANLNLNKKQSNDTTTTASKKQQQQSIDHVGKEEPKTTNIIFPVPDDRIQPKVITHDPKPKSKSTFNKKVGGSFLVSRLDLESKAKEKNAVTMVGIKRREATQQSCERKPKKKRVADSGICSIVGVLTGGDTGEDDEYTRREMERLESTLPVHERLRPKSCSQFVGNGRAVEKLQSWIEDRKNKLEVPVFATMSGPPGTGKSTVARCALSDAGYEVIEHNASDERTPQKLISVIQKTAMCSSFGPKPTALILEEIDGMYMGDIHVKEGSSSSATGTDALIKFFQKKNLYRTCNPVIMICNEIKPILPLARQGLDLRFQYVNDHDANLILSKACMKRGISLSQKASRSIIQSSHGDIRQIIQGMQMMT